MPTGATKRPSVSSPRKRRDRRLVLLGLAIRIWVVEPAVVDSDMEPTFHPGSLVFVFKAAPQLSGVHPRDVLVFASPEDNSTMIKRVVALGNQTVEVRAAVLYLDGIAPDEPFVDHETIDGTHISLRHVPPGEVFVLADNRERSIDSLDFCSLPLSSLQGLVLGAVGKSPIRTFVPLTCRCIFRRGGPRNFQEAADTLYPFLHTQTAAAQEAGGKVISSDRGSSTGPSTKQWICRSKLPEG